MQTAFPVPYIIAAAKEGGADFEAHSCCGNEAGTLDRRYCHWRKQNWNSDKTLFIAFNNCYILSSKSPQTLENTKFIASEFALMLSLVLYPFPSCYEPS